jgi:hypothetical protein
MKRLVLTFVAVGALSAPAFAADCAKDFKEFWTNIDREKMAQLTAEQMADLHRTALRVYDSCTSGDERFTAGNFFKQLDAAHYARAGEIFRSGAFNPPGAKN